MVTNVNNNLITNHPHISGGASHMVSFVNDNETSEFNEESLLRHTSHTCFIIYNYSL